MPTRRLRTDFTTFTYFSTTTHGPRDIEVNSRTEVITRYVLDEQAAIRRKRDVQQKLETTFTDLVTTFDHGRPVISTRRHTVTLGTLHITDTVALPVAATRVVEAIPVRGHIPIDPQPVDQTYYTTYTYYTTTLKHGVPVTQTRYEVVTQVRHIDATPGLPAALDRGSCQRCQAHGDLPQVVDAYTKIAPSTIYDHGHRGGHHTAYSTLTFYTTHYPRGSSYVETRYSVVSNIATVTVTNHLPGLRGPDVPCANHHHTTFTYFTTR
ncbi:hypothetical protein BIW11_04458 [Tropilaelaps mercedesae]|uniref:DUF4758 domain-containing protein n=1 Tax=Tropilaelaps mercedesae TaxID=418985 RepID=A0A1V9X6K8_9ACAR|nr:hypothetical protein BIW11_04458 [Tropilaelaps mercedesae]